MQGPNTAPLKHFTTHPNYLKSNSTSHNWAFSAFAELFDNSVDAGATEIHIKCSPDKKRVIVSDNGSGMDFEAFDRMLSLGYCEKGDTKIGKYGNGFKSGSMRLGKDAVVFTKCAKSHSVGILSQTFLEKINANEVLVPMITWGPDGSVMGDERQADKSLNIITTYSPWETEEDIQAEFKKIEETGTIIFIYNLSAVADGRSELQFTRNDIKLRERRDDPTLNATERDPPLLYSLRAYCEVLYLVPRTQMFIQETRVQTKIITRTLYLTKTSVIKLAGYPESRVTYGFNPNPKVRNINFGVFLYHRNRLIEPLLKVGSMTAPNSVGRGVLGACEISYLTPTHNKQGFMQNNLYIRLKRNLAAAFNAYWRSCVPHGGITAFWNSVPLNISDDPYIQCHLCFKWRPLPKGVPVFVSPNTMWTCADSTLDKNSTCSTPEVADLVHTSRFIKRRDEKKPTRKRKSPDNNQEEEGPAWVGLRAKAYWDVADGAKWYYGTIDDYDEETDEYKLLYDNGTFAWAAKSTFQLADEEVVSKRDSEQKYSHHEPSKKKKKIAQDLDFIIKEEANDDDAFHPDGPNVMDLNEESHENQAAIVRQKRLNSAYTSIKKVYKDLKSIIDENGEVPLDRFDGLSCHDTAIALRNDLNFILAPFEKS